MIARTFGHKTFYLVAGDADGVRGVLPLTHVRSRLFGNRMVSQAFSDHGGVLAEDPGARSMLYERAVELACEEGCESIEFRNTEPLEYDLPLRQDKVFMRLRLAADPDELWRGFGKGIRKRVRRAERSGIVVESGGDELLSDFYKTWTARMHQLGTPCYPRRLFSNILGAFPDSARIFVARLGDHTVAAKFVYSFNGLAQSRWGAALAKYRRMCPNHLLLWKVIENYCLAGGSWLDLGRSTIGSGPYHFKMHWRPQSVNLCYQYWVRPGRKLSIVSPDNARYRWKVALWKRLPLWATRLIGPYISRSLP